MKWKHFGNMELRGKGWMAFSYQLSAAGLHLLDAFGFISKSSIAMISR